jgi:hypothetical protein
MTWYTDTLTEEDESELATAHRNAKRRSHNFIRHYSGGNRDPEIIDPQETLDIYSADLYLGDPNLRGTLLTLLS